MSDLLLSQPGILALGSASHMWVEFDLSGVASADVLDAVAQLNGAYHFLAATFDLSAPPDDG